MYVDPVYMVIMLPVIGLSLLASWLVKATFNKYSKVRCMSGMTGAQAAERMLRYGCAADVRVEKIDGFLTDHYDPTKKVLRLSTPVYDSSSLSAVGVACHEAGHALQHAESYAPLVLRSTLVPVVQFSSKISQWVIMAGIAIMAFSRSPIGLQVALIGVALIALSVVFSIVTLPVEWDASARAKKRLTEFGIVGPGQDAAAGKVLNAAFLTYIAAAVSGIATIIYYLFRLGVLGDRRR